MSTFLQVVELLLTSDDAKADYANDPSSFLEGHGLGSFDSVDVADAMGHAADALPMAVAVQLDPDQGLDAAAGLDLEAQGLSLDREPLGNDEYDDTIDTDGLDQYGADGDVDFDAPDGSDFAAPDGSDFAAPESSAAHLEPIDDLDRNADDAASEVDTENDTVIDEDTPSVDPGDYLTDMAFDLPGQDAPLDPEQLEDSAAGLSSDSIDDLGAELPDDLPDDFDLLD